MQIVRIYHDFLTALRIVRMVGMRSTSACDQSGQDSEILKPGGETDSFSDGDADSDTDTDTDTDADHSECDILNSDALVCSGFEDGTMLDRTSVARGGVEWVDTPVYGGISALHSYVNESSSYAAATGIFSARMSGPFVQKTGYPWEDLHDITFYVTESTQTPSLDGSRLLTRRLEEKGFNSEYVEVNADHGGMISLVLPGIFEFFDRSRMNQR